MKNRNKRMDCNDTKHKHFDLCAMLWQGYVDAFHTAAIIADGDYRLKSLVESFDLSGDLITA